ncbi:hypothetical protein GCM10009123_09890 [Kangiella japonica]|uniref:DUF2970 domain-containing protein n=1 Tax=Kangiella japonica TaxID=647384 RepID=A0ABN0SX67_9GAMM
MSQKHPTSSHSGLDNNAESKQSQTSQSQTNHSQTSRNTTQASETNQPSKEGTGILSTLQTILGAMFGVQSEQQRQKDFEKGSPVQFIIGGIIFVVVFILTILYFVNSALENAGVS